MIAWPAAQLLTATAYCLLSKDRPIYLKIVRLCDFFYRKVFIFHALNVADDKEASAQKPRRFGTRETFHSSGLVESWLNELTSAQRRGDFCQQCWRVEWFGECFDTAGGLHIGFDRLGQISADDEDWRL
jgi:hypothetical protein